MKIDWDVLRSKLARMREMYTQAGMPMQAEALDEWMEECWRHDISGNIRWNVRMRNLNVDYKSLRKK